MSGVSTCHHDEISPGWEVAVDFSSMQDSHDDYVRMQILNADPVIPYPNAVEATIFLLPFHHFVIYVGRFERMGSHKLFDDYSGLFLDVVRRFSEFLFKLRLDFYDHPIRRLNSSAGIVGSLAFRSSSMS